LISKEQANVIADALISDAKERPPPIQRIPRGANGFLVLIISMASTMHYVDRHYPNIPVWIYVAFVLFYILGLVGVIYQFLTPLAKITRDQFVYYGYWPWDKRVFAFQEITKVSFLPRLPFWRFTRLLTLHLDGGNFKIRLPNTLGPPIAEVCKMLHANFAEKYTEH
jgi:hypothetical protein